MLTNDSAGESLISVPSAVRGAVQSLENNGEVLLLIIISLSVKEIDGDGDDVGASLFVEDLPLLLLFPFIPTMLFELRSGGCNGGYYCGALIVDCIVV